MSAWEEAVRYAVKIEIAPMWKNLIMEIIRTKKDNGKSIIDELNVHPEVANLNRYLNKISK